METFFTADIHFDHPDILLHTRQQFLADGDIERNTKVGERWAIGQAEIDKRTEAHNAFLVESINKVVGRKDTLYILGDFAFKRHGYWINAIHGKKILIVGDHDEMPKVYRDCFTDVRDLWLKEIKGRTVTLCHYPLLTWSGYGNGGACLHGHSHNRLHNNTPESVMKYGLLMDVGLDAWDFTPLTWDQIVLQMRLKNEYALKHGKKV